MKYIKGKRHVIGRAEKGKSKEYLSKFIFKNVITTSKNSGWRLMEVYLKKKKLSCI